MVRISEKTWNDLSDYRESLEHHGVKGQRWGVRKERKTSGIKRKKRTFSEKVKARRQKRAKDRVARAKARAEKEQQEAQKKAAKQAAAKEKKRKAILNNPTKLYKHRREFTADEIQAAMKQFEWEKKLADYSKNDLNNGAEYINTMFKYANNTINLYNTAARIVNSLDSRGTVLGGKGLPIIKSTKELEEEKKKKSQNGGDK